jgi:ATP phosphoribosyltransferase regulatory subunit
MEVPARADGGGPRRSRRTGVKLGASGPAHGDPKSDIRAEAAALAGGASRRPARCPVDAPLMLQPADTLLDLYGEDIRARAYTTDDPDRGEMMLRPDFTVPVVEMHAERRGARALHLSGRGLPQAARRAPAARRNTCNWASSFSTRAIRRRPMPRSSRCFRRGAAPLGLRAVTGDMGILLAAIEAVDDRRRARPRCAPCLAAAPVPRAARPLHRAGAGAARRVPLLDRVAAEGLDAVIDAAGVETGCARAEIAARIADAARRCRDAAHRRDAEADVLGAIGCAQGRFAGRLRTAARHAVDLPGLTPGRGPDSPRA